MLSLIVVGHTHKKIQKHLFVLVLSSDVKENKK